MSDRVEPSGDCADSQSFLQANNVRTAWIGGLELASLTLTETADLMIESALQGRKRDKPFYMTSANGEVVARLKLNPGMRRLFVSADLVSPDGQPMVAISRFLCKSPLPERVATTDLFDYVAERAAQRGLRFYLLGGDPEVNEKATKAAKRKFPNLDILGNHHGYFGPNEETAIVEQIARLSPDILWIGMGVPREQEFVLRRIDQLSGVGVIKTTGGLFDFIAERVKRAPDWMQRAGLEWAWRLAQEPSRLFVRYAITNPVALYAMLTDSR